MDVFVWGTEHFIGFQLHRYSTISVLENNTKILRKNFFFFLLSLPQCWESFPKTLKYWYAKWPVASQTFHSLAGKLRETGSQCWSVSLAILTVSDNYNVALRKSLCGKLCWWQSAHRSLTADTQISLTLELAEFDLFFLAKQTGFSAAWPMSSLVTSKRSLCVSNRQIVFLRFFSQNLSICEGVHVCFRGKKGWQGNMEFCSSVTICLSWQRFHMWIIMHC